MTKLLSVSIDQELADRGVSVIFALATGKLRTGTAAQGEKLWRKAQHDIDLSTVFAHPHLRAYRDLHHQFGIDDPALIPSPESLIHAFKEKGVLHSLGPIIDFYNSISLNHLISIGAHDADKLGRCVKLSKNKGSEKFRPLNQKKKILLPANEYSYKTDCSRAVCRLECKQAHETKLRENTTRWLFILQGNCNITGEALLNASNDLMMLISPFAAGFQWEQQLLGKISLHGQLEVS